MMQTKTEWHEIQVRFQAVDWADLTAGDMIWYTIPKHKNRHAHGPVIVVDPAERRLKNMQGVEVTLPQVRPILPLWPPQ